MIAMMGNGSYGSIIGGSDDCDGWESHQILLFVPPDGQFKLMSYRCVLLRRC